MKVLLKIEKHAYKVIVVVLIAFIVTLAYNIRIKAASVPNYINAFKIESYQDNEHYDMSESFYNNYYENNLITALPLNTEVVSTKTVPVSAQTDNIKSVVTDTTWMKGFETPQYIRCTGYCDYGYTKSGEYVRQGIVAGKKEWLGKTCYIYAVNTDGTCGDLIGIYEFLDTGYGINGSLINGTSIDVWFPYEDAVWDWMHTYGDYVYIQIVDAAG